MSKEFPISDFKKNELYIPPLTTERVQTDTHFVSMNAFVSAINMN